ncbi:flagellar assembly protein FliW [Metabacillus halosaccharovorans]|uniref:flagellar assembly protein FliW n=1 Tax=Metabacillus halosaccharovorans TaxID=930124 RepID=UPI0037353CE9
MKINTKYHGVIEVEESNYIHFQHGIPGFLEEREFILLPVDKESPFFIMQSRQTPELGFVVTNPFLFFEEYEFEISEHEKEELKINKETEIQILSILSVKDPFSESTANLQAPIVVNKTSNLAKQIILNDTLYTTKHKFVSKTTQK